MVYEGKPMIDYENMSKLLLFSYLKDFPRTHWSNLVGWKMASYACSGEENQGFGLSHQVYLPFL
jgi:hypothetical protein